MAGKPAPKSAKPAAKAAGRGGATARKVQTAVVLLRGTAMPPSPFELGCPGTRIKVEYDPRNMVGAGALGYAAFAGGEPEELASLACSFQHEGQSYPLIAVPLLPGSRMRALAKVQRDGVLKAAADAAREMGRGNPDPVHWWLAVRFALHGYVPRQEYVRATIALKTSFDFIPLVEQRGDVLIWRPFIERKARELAERIEKERKRNPFLESVEQRQVQRWLELDRPLLAGIAMRAVAEHYGTATLDTFAGSMLRLPPGAAVPPAKRNAADEVLAIFERGEGLPLNKLIERWPSHRVVIKQLIDAGHLIESEEGFVFTERQVTDWLTKLKLRADAPIPGVGDIKKLLGLPRKDAEQLRALLLAKAEGPAE